MQGQWPDEWKRLFWTFKPEACLFRLYRIPSSPSLYILEQIYSLEGFEVFWDPWWKVKAIKVTLLFYCSYFVSDGGTIWNIFIKLHEYEWRFSGTSTIKLKNLLRQVPKVWFTAECACSFTVISDHKYCAEVIGHMNILLKIRYSLIWLMWLSTILCFHNDHLYTYVYYSE